MKVAILGDPLAYGPTSMAKYIYSLVKNLGEMYGDSVEFFLIIPKKVNIQAQSLKTIIIPHNLPKNKVLRALFKLPCTIARTIKILQFCTNEKIDLLHIPFTASLSFYLIMRLFSDLPLVQTIHGARNTLNLGINLPIRWKIRYMINATILALIIKIASFRRIITVSNSAMKNIIKAFKVDENNISVVYHGIEKVDTPHKEAPLQLSQKYLFHISSYMPKKNVEGILRAFALMRERYKVNDVMLVIGGNQPKHLRKLVDKLGIKDSVTFAGFIKEEDLPAYYKNAEALVFPSFHESFGMPILEAMVYGCPVITSDVYATKEIAGDAALLVNPYRIEEIADAMYKIISDEALKSRLRFAGKKRSKFFSWKKCASEHMKIYENIYGSTW